MKEIRIKVTDEEYELMQLKAEDVSTKSKKITPNRILQQFVSDLTASDQSGGSDERDYAYYWFERSVYNF